MSRKRPAEEVIDFDLDGSSGAAPPSDNDGGPGRRRRRVGAAAAGWGLAEVLAECGLDLATGDEDGAFCAKGDRPEERAGTRHGLGSAGNGARDGA